MNRSEEEALQWAERDFRSALESSPLGVCITSTGGDLVYANRAALELWGYGGIDELRRVPEEERFAPQSYMEQGARREKRRQGTPAPSEYEVSIRRKDGEIRHLAAFSGDVAWNGETHVQVLYQDVTGLRRTREQMQRSQLLATLGEMTAGMAHEVNNPLGSILLYSELVLAADVPPQVKKDLRVIRGEAKRAARVMTDALTYGQRVDARTRRVDLHGVLKRVLSMRRYSERVQNVTVTLRFLDAPLYVLGSPSQLAQLFMNLVLNAEEALEQTGGGNLVITTEQEGEWARVSVADDGTGIPEEDLDRVFYPFFTTKQEGQGVGLGLSACYGIATAYGGLIRALNNEMGGATLVVELPLAAAKRQDSPSPRAVADTA